jgi:hypothetical protein
VAILAAVDQASRRRVWVGCVLVCALAWATTAEAQGAFERVWIDANVGLAVAAQDTFAMSAPVERFDEPATLSARYTLPRAPSFDIGAGVLITRTFGIGASYDGTMHEHAAELRAHIPHPLIADAAATDVAETDPVMQRIERSLSVHAMVVVAQTRRLRFRVFGGPIHYRLEQDAVDAITYNQIYFVRQPTNIVQLTGFNYKRVDGSGWGGHVGADASLFLTRLLGVGLFTKYDRGRVALDNPLAAGLGHPERVTITAGGLQVGAGVRLKF